MPKKSRSNNKKCKRGGEVPDYTATSPRWFGSWFDTAQKAATEAGVKADEIATGVVDGTKGAVSSGTEYVQNAVGTVLAPTPPVGDTTVGDTTVGDTTVGDTTVVQAGGGKRRKKSKRRIPTLKVPNLANLKMAMGLAQSRTKARSQSKSRALAGGRVHAYSSGEMSAMAPAGFDSKGTSYLIGGKTRRKKRRGKNTRGKRTRGRGKKTRGRGKRGGQIW